MTDTLLVGRLRRQHANDFDERARSAPSSEGSPSVHGPVTRRFEAKLRYWRRHMNWGRIAGVSLLMVGVAGASVAAEKPTLADAAEQRNRALIRTLLDAGADVNAAQVDGMTALRRVDV